MWKKNNIVRIFIVSLEYLGLMVKQDKVQLLQILYCS